MGVAGQLGRPRRIASPSQKKISRTHHPPLSGKLRVPRPAGGPGGMPLTRSVRTLCTGTSSPAAHFILLKPSSPLELATPSPLACPIYGLSSIASISFGSSIASAGRLHGRKHTTTLSQGISTGSRATVSLIQPVCSRCKKLSLNASWAETRAGLMVMLLNDTHALACAWMRSARPGGRAGNGHERRAQLETLHERMQVVEHG